MTNFAPLAASLPAAQRLRRMMTLPTSPEAGSPNFWAHMDTFWRARGARARCALEALGDRGVHDDIDRVAYDALEFSIRRYDLEAERAADLHRQQTGNLERPSPKLLG